MNKYLDIFYLMAYDFNGGWSNLSGHQANLFDTGTSGDKAVSDYISAGVSPQKIVYGMPIYGRSFQNTDGLNKPFSGTGKGTWEEGAHDYKKIPYSGAQEIFDEQAGRHTVSESLFHMIPHKWWRESVSILRRMGWVVPCSGSWMRMLRVRGPCFVPRMKLFANTTGWIGHPTI